jgi:hypothetical protein
MQQSQSSSSGLIGLMRWQCPGVGDGEKILYLKPPGAYQWKPYTAYPNLMKPDYSSAFGLRMSKGFSTAQHLLKCGWQYEPSPQQSSPQPLAISPSAQPLIDVMEAYLD